MISKMTQQDDLFPKLVELLAESDKAMEAAWTRGFCGGRDDLRAEAKAAADEKVWRDKVSAVLNQC